MASYRGPPPSLSGWPFHVSDRSPILEIDPTEMVQRTCPHLFDPGQPPTHFTPSAMSTRKMTALVIEVQPGLQGIIDEFPAAARSAQSKSSRARSGQKTRKADIGRHLE